MLLIDPLEAPYLPSSCLELPHALVTSLEERTGADIVLSIWDAPATTTALQWRHVNSGVGYQLKRGADLISSIQDGRIMHQLARMRQTWDECWAVHVAEISMATISDDWEPVIDGIQQGWPYSSYLSAVRNWQRAGGYWITLDSNYPFAQWIQDELDRMSRDTDERLVRKPQVKLLPLSPQEETLATFPGIGPTRAHALWMALTEHEAAQTLTQALVWLSDGWATKAEGIGKGVVRAARVHLGLDDEENLGLYYNGDWPELKGR